MRLLTWNINGIRTLPLYHPWNALKTGENILNELNADIICFQEVKSSRQGLEKHLALPAGYDAFFSFPQVKGGYSGVAVYTKHTSAVPLKAEEGLSGRLQSGLKPPLSEEERVSPEYPSADDIDLMPDEEVHVPLDLIELDKEGRALVLDFGLFVLINLYCPNETSDARLPYKVNFHRLLSERIRRLTEEEGREVIVTGDINVCAAPIDHCDGELASKQGEDFYAHPARKWFHDWLAPRGPMVDVVRNCWPGRKGMFTCWNQKIDARVSNYGTRIDYFLLTKGLLPWFKHGDIQPSIKGSDHCPVYIDLHDEITSPEGEKLKLRDMMKAPEEGTREPPRLASKYWVEYSGKQKLLSSFFGKKAGAAEASATTSKEPSVEPATKEESEPLPASEEEESQSNDLFHPSQATLLPDSESPPPVSSTDANTPNRSPRPPASEPKESVVSATLLSGPSQTSRAQLTENPQTGQSSEPTPAPAHKRKKIQADSNYPATQPPKKAKKSTIDTSKSSAKVTGTSTKTKSKKPAQTSIASFFSTAPSSSQPTERTSSQSQIEPIDVDELLLSDDIQNTINCPSSTEASSSNGNGKSKVKSSQSWSNLFARVKPPNCIVHREPAREFTVNKPGPNRGKKFFLCSRPVGPGYDAGKDKRAREDVDPRYRCNFFKWSSEVRQEAQRSRQFNVE